MVVVVVVLMVIVVMVMVVVVMMMWVATRHFSLSKGHLPICNVFFLSHSLPINYYLIHYLFFLLSLSLSLTLFIPYQVFLPPESKRKRNNT